MPEAFRSVVGEGPTIVAGRYAIYDAVASGGMATVHVGRLLGSAGFLRTVAIKRLHPQFANNQDFAAMFLDEARLAARVQHPNVVQTLDVVVDGNELLLVMEYVRGISLSQLTRAAREKKIRIPPPVVVAIMSGVLRGLHAAHEATDERGMPLDIVHRDVSPQNVLVGVDGTARVLDFGIAKAAGRLHETREGEIKGKLLYMAPEQLAAEGVSRVTDVYAAGIVLFETLTSVRMFAGEQEAAAITKILKSELRMPSSIAPELAPFDAAVRRAAAIVPADRYPNAHEMACELERIVAPASPADVGEWVMKLGGNVLDERAKMVAHVERSSTRSKPPPALAGSTSSASMVAGTSRGPAPSSGAFASGDTLPSSGSLRSSSISASGLRASHATITSGFSAQLAVANAESETRSFRSEGKPRRSFTMAVVIALAASLVVAIGIIVALVGRPRDGAAHAATASAVGSAAATDDVAAPLAKRAAAPSAETPVVTTTPPSASTSSRPPSSSSPAPAPAPKASSDPAPARTQNVKPPVKAAPNVSCDPPYTIDKKGHRHFIPECVQ